MKLNKSEVPWQETLFYTHLLSIPVFVLVANDVYYYGAVVLGQCDNITVSRVGTVPRGAALLLMNVLTQVCFSTCSVCNLDLLSVQYLCIRGVYKLIGITNSLSCSFVLK